MNMPDKLHRRLTNTISTAIAATAGLVYLPEVFTESPLGSLDDIVVVLLALIAMGWYFYSNNRVKYSRIPILLVAGSFCSKSIGAILEWGTDEVADNLVAVTALGIGLAIVTYLYLKKPLSSVSH